MTTMTKQQQKHHNRPLAPSDLLELRESFEIFDDEKTGRITTHSLKIMARALGFRVTRDKIMECADDAKRRRNDAEPGVDFATVCDVMAGRYAKRNPEQELQKAFRLFDDDDTGGITLKNLKSIARQLGEDDRLSDDDLRAMIDEFDMNQDGEISMEEFRFIMFREGSTTSS
eukprot:CAMPEP_0172481666 /NCGR_PEP_ID=MMETSP1066-20121228/7717_1 /TAXON_ID=671091 /ORGANISM="Coscinodiscus wailesii, Strain CCMP2513" /LENGTH=171 /DNA_ID=CAMNT_0013244189 /DNA_START=265 /DNA_END=780 /DNA_ORIENTATION=+